MSIFVLSEHMISSLGNNTQEVINAFEAGNTGLSLCDDKVFSPTPFITSLVENELLEKDIKSPATKMEKMILYSINKALEKTDLNIQSDRVAVVFSTVKGNIDLFDEQLYPTISRDRLFFGNVATFLQQELKLKNQPIVISNACISGVLAINYAKDLIDIGMYDHVIVTGADIVSEFTVSGFQSFQAISQYPCRPFDKNRDGISLGEACGTIILTNDKNRVTNSTVIAVKEGVSSNDANHISGPSRTGEGLYVAIQKILKNYTIDFISAHGTGTLYNDEMEAIAFSRAGLEEVPINSFKGYWGHTLGAAGIIESIATLQSMQNNRLYKSIGFQELGVSIPINIIQENQTKEINTCLKTASGFGGCNAVVIFEKYG